MVNSKVPDEAGVREYLIDSKKFGLVKIKIPETWKVTYSKLIPNSRNQDNYGNNNSSPYALRIYENDTKQRACFTDVTYFRDLSIQIFSQQNADGSWEELANGEEVTGRKVLDGLADSDEPKKSRRGI